MTQAMHSANAGEPAKVPRKPRVPKKKERSKNAMLLAIAIVISLANLLLIVKLGIKLT